MTDADKLAFFVARYRSLDTEELTELSARVDSLADEAATALRQVLAERKMASPASPASSPGAEPGELTEEERKAQSKLSSDLFNGPLGKRVEWLFAAQALVFGTALTGSQGLRLGALPLVVITAVLAYGAGKLGRATTRSICSNAQTSIAMKTKSLKTLSLWLLPAVFPSAMAGIIIARAFTHG